MKRALKISSDAIAAQTGELFVHRRCSARPQKGSQNPALKTLYRACGTASGQSQLMPELRTPDPSESQLSLAGISGLFIQKYSSVDTMAKKIMREQVSVLKDELLENSGEEEMLQKVLEQKGVPLFRMYSDGSAVVELLKQLSFSPYLALQVFNWRREQVDYLAPMTTEEYAKCITLAGRLKNLDLAEELFSEADTKKLKSTSTHNALMSAYMFSGLAPKCLSKFEDLKRDSTCCPTIATYNILISVFGRSMRVDHMEEIIRQIEDLNLSPDVDTYNKLIAGYLTAWMWDKMEKTYQMMKADNVKPDLSTYLLMLRGYAHSGKLDKMEEIYERVKYHVDCNEIPLIRAMISAYYRSSVPNRVERIEELLKLIPKDEYRAWLNVMLICLYANEDLLEQMEDLITEAFERNTSIRTTSIMRCIISSYFRQDAVDKLANFVKRAELAGWKICRSLYHCKMVMYASQRRLMEMERVLDDMEKVNMYFTKKRCV